MGSGYTFIRSIARPTQGLGFGVWCFGVHAVEFWALRTGYGFRFKGLYMSTRVCLFCLGWWELRIGVKFKGANRRTAAG